MNESEPRPVHTPAAATTHHSRLRIRRLGIDTHQEAIIDMRAGCHVCRAEGFAAHARIEVAHKNETVIVTLHSVAGALLGPGEAGLSEWAWKHLAVMRRVVEREGGCVVWGGAVRLSPTDDVLIRIERALDLDAEARLVASVVSKKVAAGATHLVLDIPVGPTAKVRDALVAQGLAARLRSVSGAFGVMTQVVVSDGSEPVGRGMGPALEARDVLAVVRRDPLAPVDLADRAVALAGALLELTGAATAGRGPSLARQALNDGRAQTKLEAICEAQGELREPPAAAHTCDVTAPRAGTVAVIDNRRIARLEKLAGAPHSKAAGVVLHVRVGDPLGAGEPLMTVHAESTGELGYAMRYADANPDIVRVEEAG